MTPFEHGLQPAERRDLRHIRFALDGPNAVALIVAPNGHTYQAPWLRDALDRLCSPRDGTVEGQGGGI